MSFWSRTPDKKQKRGYWLPLLMIGIVCLLVGIYQEQLTDIYRKAVMICLECIGIG
ncbi:MAG: hypothetical protein IJ327_04380 [Lachnospiraceae bacterium]|nr:hypothetical protein [Lachnospiraceae bacterium]